MIKWMVYIDPTVPFLAQKYLYLISLSTFIFVFLFSPPLILLIVYPTSLFRVVSRRLKPKWNIAIKTYVDTFHGCYNDGTSGTRDYRAVSGYLLAMGGLLPALQIEPRSFLLLSCTSVYTVLWCPDLCLCTATAIQTQVCQHDWCDAADYSGFGVRTFRFCKH